MFFGTRTKVVHKNISQGCHSKKIAKPFFTKFQKVAGLFLVTLQSITWKVIEGHFLEFCEKVSRFFTNSSKSEC